MTLSSFYANQELTDAMLTEFFNNRTKNYTPISELKSITTENKIWIEREIHSNDIYWIWWAISYANQIVLASVNSEKIVTAEDHHLYTFMLDKMELYPKDDND